jgi:lysophospholipase L1-like esterase
MGSFASVAPGLRSDREYSLTKPVGAFRILVIGDSIAYGFGVAQRDALSEQFEDLLQEQRAAGVARFEALNLGMTGYNIVQVAEQLHTHRPTYERKIPASTLMPFKTSK